MNKAVKFLMEKLCKGFEDWLFCINCPYLCTKICPFEGESVIEELKEQILLLSVTKETKDRKALSK